MGTRTDGIRNRVRQQQGPHPCALASSFIAGNTGDRARALNEAERGREAAVDPFYRGIVESWLGAILTGDGRCEAARPVIEPALRFAEEREIALFALMQRLNESMLLLSEGELTAGMNQLTSVERESASLSFLGETIARANRAVVYARMATGEAKGSLGVMFRNPGFVLKHARNASQTARDSLADLSENLPPDLEGLRFLIEFEFAKLLIKRKERDEARRHLEKAIAFLQPLGDSVGMRDTRALLASLDARAAR
jgi:tetratricopeptide (TPR) repeat protein